MRLSLGWSLGPLRISIPLGSTGRRVRRERRQVAAYYRVPLPGFVCLGCGNGAAYRIRDDAGSDVVHACGGCLLALLDSSDRGAYVLVCRL